MNRSGFIKIAHRGASGLAPENTLQAFSKALEIGVDGVELDVHGTADGELVVLHDRTLDRTTDRTGFVNEMALAKIREADAGASQEEDPRQGNQASQVEGEEEVDGHGRALLRQGPGPLRLQARILEARQDAESSQGALRPHGSASQEGSHSSALQGRRQGQGNGQIAQGGDQEASKGNQGSPGQAKEGS